MTTQVLNKISIPSKQENIHPHAGFVSRETRNRKFGHKSGVVWLTGLSGSGKSTIATNVEQRMFEKNYLISILDGDTVRTGLNSDLSFDTLSRKENLRRTGEVASLFSKAGHIVLASFISPHDQGRQTVREIVGDNFYLVHIDAEIEDCIKRDPKGLYKKAASGEIKNFTGISQSYDKPQNPELIINTSMNDIEKCTSQLINFIEKTFSEVNSTSQRSNKLIQQ